MRNGAPWAPPEHVPRGGHSPAALKSMWGAFDALGGGALPARLGEHVAGAITNRNACEYYLAAHTVSARRARVRRMSEAQAGRSADPKTAAALRLALAVVERRGQVEGSRWRRCGRLASMMARSSSCWRMWR